MTGGVRSAAIALACALAAPAFLQSQQERPIRERTAYEDLQLFSQVLNQIRVNHPDSLSAHTLFMAAVEGLVRAADPHSYVIRAERLSPAREKALREGRLVPVPITFRMVGGAHVVLGVHPGSEAMRSDILPGDELVAIDEQSFIAGSTAELDILLAGDNGSIVRLRFERRREDGSLVQLDRPVKRQRLDPPSAVAAVLLLDDGTGYIRITSFAHQRVTEDLRRAMSDLEKQGMARLILDLRDNGGGFLRDAAEAAGLFLPRGAIVYTAEGRKPEVTDTARVRRALWRPQRQYPVALLVNQGTASAAEIVAGALQDHDRALVVGRTTFGKSLIMQGFPLSDGSLMVLVVGTVRTPCGRSVQREYRQISSRDYYRTPMDDRSRVGRPTCTTPAGRTVYGGGGIHPDVLVDDVPTPSWLARILEGDLLLAWMPGFIEQHRASLESSFAGNPAGDVPTSAVLSFRAFAAAGQAQLPDGPEADDDLARALLPRLAYAIGGPDAYYRAIARTDPEVRAAANALTASPLAGS